jgi:hypothetical protein
MSIPQMPLRDAKILSLLATDEQSKVVDFDGLFLLAKPSGTKSWRFKYRFAGKGKLKVFGDYPRHYLYAIPAGACRSLFSSRRT